MSERDLVKMILGDISFRAQRSIRGMEEHDDAQILDNTGLTRELACYQVGLLDREFNIADLKFKVGKGRDPRTLEELDEVLSLFTAGLEHVRHEAPEVIPVLDQSVVGGEPIKKCRCLGCNLSIEVSRSEDGTIVRPEREALQTFGVISAFVLSRMPERLVDSKRSFLIVPNTK